MARKTRISRKVWVLSLGLLLATLGVYHVWLERQVARLEGTRANFTDGKQSMVRMQTYRKNATMETENVERIESPKSPSQSIDEERTRSDSSLPFMQGTMEDLQLPRNCTADQPCHVLIAVNSFIGNEQFRYHEQKQCEPGLDCHWCNQKYVPPHLQNRIDAVAYHMVRRANGLGIPQHNNRVLTIGASMESNANYPKQKQARRNFDLTMTYELTSDIPIPYLNYGDQLKLQHSKRASLEGRLKVAAYVASNCEKSRQAYVANLIQHGLPVHSLGSCRVEGAVNKPIHKVAGEKIKAISNYAAYLAFENSDATDYVTEKVYDGLRAGTITVYKGTESVNKFVPKNSIITVNGQNIGDLVKKINETWNDEAKYAELQAWRKNKFYPEALKPTEGHSHCRACRAVAAVRSLSEEALAKRRKGRKATFNLDN